jgi:hypothetical protein
MYPTLRSSGNKEYIANYSMTDVEEQVQALLEEAQEAVGAEEVAAEQPQQQQRWRAPWSEWSFSESWMGMALWWCATPCVSSDTVNSRALVTPDLNAVQDHMVKVEKNIQKTEGELKELADEKEQAIAAFRQAAKNGPKPMELAPLADAVNHATMLHERKQKSMDYLVSIRMHLRLYIQSLIDKERQFVQVNQLQELTDQISDHDEDAKELIEELRNCTQELGKDVTTTKARNKQTHDKVDRIRAALAIVESIDHVQTKQEDPHEEHEDTERLAAKLPDAPRGRITTVTSPKHAVAALDSL